jgi:hypothetical protein
MVVLAGLGREDVPELEDTFPQAALVPEVLVGRAVHPPGGPRGALRWRGTVMSPSATGFGPHADDRDAYALGTSQ